MNMFMQLVGKNVLEQVRDLKRSLLLLCIPMAIFICINTYFQVNDIEFNFVRPIHVGVAVEDESIYSQMLVNDFKSMEDFSKFFVIEQGDSQHVKRAFNKGQLDAYLIIPESYVKDLMNFDYNPMEVKIDQSDPVTAMILHNAFLAYERYIFSVEKGVTSFYQVLHGQVANEVYWDYNNALSIELIMTMINREQMYEYHPLVDIPSSTSGDYYFIAISIMFIFLISLFLGVSLIEEVNSSSFRRLMTTRINLKVYLLAKVTAMTLFTLVTFLIWTGIYSIATRKGFIFIQTSLITTILLTIIVASIISLLLAGLIHSESNMVLFAGVFVFLNGILGGSIIPVQYMPEGLRGVSEWTPNFLIIRSVLFRLSGISYPGNLWLMIGLLVVSLIGFLVMVRLVDYRIRRGKV